MRWVLVGVAGALGAMACYGVGLAVGVRSFPWATLGINVAGSFVLGWVLTAGPSRWSQQVVTAVAIGFLGAFTTFSTFSYETQTMLRTDRPTAALAYVGLSLAAGVGAAAAGYAVGTALAA